MPSGRIQQLQTEVLNVLEIKIKIILTNRALIRMWIHSLD